MTTYAYADACSAAIYAKDAAGADVVVGTAVCLPPGLSDFLLLAAPLLQAGPRGISLGDRRQRIPIPAAFATPTGPGGPPAWRTLKLGFTPFPPGHVSRLGILPVAYDAIDLDDAPPAPTYVLVVPDAEHARAPSRAMTVVPASAEGYRTCGALAGTHLVGTIGPERGGRDLIGCGLWRRTVTGDLLRGIVVDIRPGLQDGRSYVVATHPCVCLLGMAHFLGIDSRQSPGDRPARRASVRRPD